jgi:hypothetical protein
METTALQQKNDVFYAICAEMLQAGQVNGQSLVSGVS